MRANCQQKLDSYEGVQRRHQHTFPILSIRIRIVLALGYGIITSRISNHRGCRVDAKGPSNGGGQSKAALRSVCFLALPPVLNRSEHSIILPTPQLLNRIETSIILALPNKRENPIILTDDYSLGRDALHIGVSLYAVHRPRMN